MTPSTVFAWSRTSKTTPRTRPPGRSSSVPRRNPAVRSCLSERRRVQAMAVSVDEGTIRVVGAAAKHDRRRTWVARARREAHSTSAPRRTDAERCSGTAVPVESRLEPWPAGRLRAGRRPAPSRARAAAAHEDQRDLDDAALQRPTPLSADEPGGWSRAGRNRADLHPDRLKADREIDQEAAVAQIPEVVRQLLGHLALLRRVSASELGPARDARRHERVVASRTARSARAPRRTRAAPAAARRSPCRLSGRSRAGEARRDAPGGGIGRTVWMRASH